jgi:predicted nucleic acid-binding protein
VTAIKVVDASAVAALLFGEPEAEAVAQRLTGARLLSTVLLDFELSSVCWKKCRRDPRRRDAYLAAYWLCDRLAIEVAAVDRGAALEVALKTGLTVYDASYLWLSRSLSAELVTLDVALEREARAGR